MSWGERSCLKPCRCSNNCTYETCNVDCIEYIWDQKTKPDSIKKSVINEKMKEMKDEIESLSKTERKLNRHERRALNRQNRKG